MNKEQIQSSYILLASLNGITIIHHVLFLIVSFILQFSEADNFLEALYFGLRVESGKIGSRGRNHARGWNHAEPDRFPNICTCIVYVHVDAITMFVKVK